MLFECWNSVNPLKSILLTNEGINQKTFGVKPLRLDPSLTTVATTNNTTATTTTITTTPSTTTITPTQIKS